MTAGTNPITHPAHRDTRRTGAQRFASLVAAATRIPRSATTVRSPGGQLGPMREAEFGRRSGARI
jgi:hypothetical protein